MKGSYHPLVPHLKQLDVRQLVLEFATPRAGELGALLGSSAIRENEELGLGVINPRTEEVEPVDAVVARVEEALQYLPPERIFLNPDCGFGTFSSRPMNSTQIIERKLETMARAAAVLRDRYGGNTPSRVYEKPGSPNGQAQPRASKNTRFPEAR